MEIRFSDRATKALVSIIENKWNFRTASRFTDNVYKVIDSLETQPNLFPLTQLENVRNAIITNEASLLYKVHQDHIEILFFWDHRQKPSF